MGRAKYLVIERCRMSEIESAFYTSWYEPERFDPDVERIVIDRVRDLVSFDGGNTWNDIENE